MSERLASLAAASLRPVTGTAARPLVVVAASARALAECLRRAGLPLGGAPLLAVDAFGDDDLMAAVDGWQALPLADLRQPERVMAAVTAVLQRGGAGPAGPGADILLGGGLDAAHAVIEALAGTYRLLNAPPPAWRAARDPLLFARLGIAAPETRLTPPDDGRGWLRKQTGGSAGLGVMAATDLPRRGAVLGCAPESPETAAHVDAFWQRRIAGTPVSLLFCAHAGGILAVGVNRQWCSPVAAQPFAFGGVASAFEPGPRASDALLEAAARVTQATGLRGLASLDALLDRQGRCLALELNPRPTASVELYDRAAPGLLGLHRAAVLGEPLPDWRPASGSRALALLRAPLALQTGPRPHAAADWRQGAVVAAGAPLCTLQVAAPDTQTAMRRVRAAAARLRRRLAQAPHVAAPGDEGFPYNPGEPSRESHRVVISAPWSEHA